MSDYAKYVDAVNKIFDSINEMKEKWTNQDNLNYIEKIEDYKAIVIETSKKLKEKKNKTVTEELN
ncbi:MAG: hypothetical protein E7160_02030 [Firmicutes bacterium]|nr:hypothetical protein [Bacillota bacterium]